MLHYTKLSITLVYITKEIAMQLYTQLLPLSAHAHTKDIAILTIPIRPTLYTAGQFFRFN